MLWSTRFSTEEAWRYMKTCYRYHVTRSPYWSPLNMHDKVSVQASHARGNESHSHGISRDVLHAAKATRKTRGDDSHVKIAQQSHLVLIFTECLQLFLVGRLRGQSYILHGLWCWAWDIPVRRSMSTARYENMPMCYITKCLVERRIDWP